ncbi:hypothetical protein A9Q96_11335 [Rhodobacterales bacterium 52_120_T64]|nr:hypothetical protein A9Q96_11335 [Rhodobacterales bacterium 52_120_T64]
MILLIAGILIWTVVHLFKRLLPEARVAIEEKLGAGPVKGIVALILLASIGIMVLGFMAAGAQAVYMPPSWGAGLNSLIMIVAVFLMGAGNGKGVLPTLLRHPMLTGVILWSGGHLLANGDMRSIVLFGGLGIWAMLSMLAINLREGAWDRPESGPLKGDIKVAVISLIVFGMIARVHNSIGPSTFGA